MGIDAGFDMVPRLSRGTADTQNWGRFINVIKDHYKDDAQVETTTNCILFKVGEYPSLPFEGHKFLRFSSKVSGATGSRALRYINTITALAKANFGSRIQYWSDAFDQLGHYNWDEVNESLKSYDEPILNTLLMGTEPKEEVGNPLFEVKQVPGKGKGLVARLDIDTGTRIICEKPLLTAESMPPEALELVLASKLKAMTKTEQRQYFSLHNNFPGKPVLGSILKTNGLPCGTDSSAGGIYPTICLINHSCLPNSHNNWDEAAEHETIHAIRPIKAGEEITIPYDHGGPSAERQAFLKSAFGFDCKCSTCTLPPAELRDSDARRVLIQSLDEAIGDPYRMATKPMESLRDCHSLLKTLKKEFKDYTGAHGCRLYYDAFQICISHGDQARASAFAEKAYRARVCCEGEDSPETKRMKALSTKPTEHMSYGLLSKKWNTTRKMVPKGLDEAQFEAWLFREQR